MSPTSDLYSASMGDETKRVQLTYELKRGNAHIWTMRNPVLRAGEPGVEIETGFFKLGDGVNPWQDLPYYVTADEMMARVQAMIANSPGGGTGGVSEVEFQTHIDSEEPHPNYDDGTSFILRYENAKV